MEVVLYRSETCPKCKVLELKLKQKQIEFSECLDMTKMSEMGLHSVPWLQVDGGDLMNFGEAIKWVNSMEAVNG